MIKQINILWNLFQISSSTTITPSFFLSKSKCNYIGLMVKAQDVPL